ncbi:hypothetical protein BCAR13_80141 [Paraburkholderia caribensis]|nr:hypothetical protein BCAR13_80141 [Paraburkholderia caribensis]
MTSRLKYFAGKSPLFTAAFPSTPLRCEIITPRCAVYILLPVPRCGRATGRISTTAVAGQPVLWDSLEIPAMVAKLAPGGERLTSDAGLEGHLTMLGTCLKASLGIRRAQLHQEVLAKNRLNAREKCLNVGR